VANQAATLVPTVSTTEKDGSLLCMKRAYM
jgi:hypothetical protein